MDFFYDGQIRRYVTQFMRIFIGFKYEAGDGKQQTVPVMYGDLTRQVANIIRENSENKMPTVPRMACYITGLELDTSRLSDPSFISKVNIRERAYTTDDAGARTYTGAQGKNVTVERIMPTPFKLTMKCDIWTSNTDQKLQLLEQILVLFNPALEIQTTDNYIDWTSLSSVYLESTNFSSRSIPAGTENDIDVCSLDFSMNAFISPPAKVKKLGIIRSIIANIFTEDGDVKNISTLVYNGNDSNTVYVNPRFPVLLFKANNGQDYDYELTIIDPYAAVQSVKLDEKESVGPNKKYDWNAILNRLGKFTPASFIYFRQPNGYEMKGTFAIHPTDPTILLVTFDQDTIPANTVIESVNRATASQTTIDAIVDPTRFNPIDKWNGLANIPVGTRYLLLDNIGDPDGPSPEAWKGTDGSTLTNYQLSQNNIIEWDGSSWITVFDTETATDTTYITNLTTGIQYKWDGIQWLKSFEGEYAAGYWRLDPDPA